MTQLPNTPTVGQRLTSMFVDHFIMTFVIAICSTILILPLALIPNENLPYGIDIFSGGIVGTIVFILFSLYFNKDILDGRSPAKRILRLQVVDDTTNQAAKPLKCLLRNLTLIIWPIEVIVTLFNPTQRLGDRLAHTKVVLFDKSKGKENLDKKAIIKTLILGLFSLIVAAVLILFFQIFALI